MKLSKEALELLTVLFNKSDLKIPVQFAEQVVEIKEWLRKQSEKH